MVTYGFGDSGAIIAMIGGFLWLFVLLFIALYVYSALALMNIAKRTNTKNPWLAWIPIANMYLMTQIGGVPWWTLLIVVFAGFIPFVGGIVSVVLIIWWWWKIAEARQRPGWWGILMMIPVVNLILMGVLAWGKK